MKCLINQPAGLGDILFTLKIGIKFSKIYEEVIWPVIPEYMWLNDYLELPDNLNFRHDQAFPGYEFFNGKRILKTDKYHYFPLRWAAHIYPRKLIMNSKYRLVNMDFSNWGDYLKIIRNKKQEEKLLNTFPKKYNLLCSLFGSPPDSLKIDLSYLNLENIQYITYKNGFTPFDWMGVIENAESLHLVDTVYSYIIEKCNLKTNDLNLYSRVDDENTWLETKHLFKTDWKYNDLQLQRKNLS